jgi:RNA polymerase sigma-70 factor (ECF subfamily)
LAIGTEWDLVQHSIAGDSNAQKQLFATHTAKLYRIAFALLRNREDAEDALQESWFKAYKNLRSFEGRSSFSTWLTRIVINSALMLRRKKNVRPEASLDEILGAQSEPFPHGMVNECPSPEEICAITEINVLVQDEIRQLPPGIQIAFRLREVDGLSTTESIEALGIQKSAFKSRISRARKKLAGALQRSFQTPVQLPSAAGGRS